MRAAGLDVTVTWPAPGRPNVVGRGAYDMKAGLAAAMSAAATVEGLAGDVIVAAVCDEEAGGIGTRALLAGDLRADAAIVTEPTDLMVAIAHKGFAGFEFETRGRAAHGSAGAAADDAILAMGPVLTGPAEIERQLRAGPAHPLLGTGSLHASLIDGGQEASSCPARCLLTGEWRTVPGDDPKGVLDDMARSTEAASRMTYTGAPLDTPQDSEIAVLVKQTAASGLGAMAFWADSALLSAAGIPTVLYGPRGAGAHAVDEWVDLASAVRVRDVLREVATRFCGPPARRRS